MEYPVYLIPGALPWPGSQWQYVWPLCRGQLGIDIGPHSSSSPVPHSQSGCLKIARKKRIRSQFYKMEKLVCFTFLFIRRWLPPLFKKVLWPRPGGGQSKQTHCRKIMSYNIRSRKGHSRKYFHFPHSVFSSFLLLSPCLLFFHPFLTLSSLLSSFPNPVFSSFLLPHPVFSSFLLPHPVFPVFSSFLLLTKSCLSSLLSFSSFCLACILFFPLSLLSLPFLLFFPPPHSVVFRVFSSFLLSHSVFLVFLSSLLSSSLTRSSLSSFLSFSLSQSCLSSILSSSLSQSSLSSPLSFFSLSLAPLLFFPPSSLSLPCLLFFPLPVPTLRHFLSLAPASSFLSLKDVPVCRIK
jgi:hypothetical protein